MNITVSLGNLTDEPKVDVLANGMKKATFSLALNRTKEGADYPRFTAWDKRAEVIEKYCHKGTKLAVVGHIQTGSYEKDGKKVYTTDIIVDRLDFYEKKPKDGSEGQPTENPKDDWMDIPKGIEEQLPFA